MKEWKLSDIYTSFREQSSKSKWVREKVGVMVVARGNKWQLWTYDLARGKSVAMHIILILFISFA